MLYGDFPALLVKEDLRCRSMRYFRLEGTQVEPQTIRKLAGLASSHERINNDEHLCRLTRFALYFFLYKAYFKFWSWYPQLDNGLFRMYIQFAVQLKCLILISLNLIMDGSKKWKVDKFIYEIQLEVRLNMMTSSKYIPSFQELKLVNRKFLQHFQTGIVMIHTHLFS